MSNENLGFGVMIKRLGGNRSTVEAYNNAMGKEIATVEHSDKDLTFTFTDGAQLVATDDGQSCCEHRYMTCDDDLTAFVGHKLVSLELGDGPSISGDYDEHDQQFLKVQTDKGSFTVANHNEHNGYYGGFAITLAWKPA